MKKRIFCLLTAVCMIVSLLAFSSCGKDIAPEEGTVTRITVDINPSVEFIVDDQNKIVSVTALNDDGSILIAGEAMVGMTPEEATAHIVTLAVETGYLIGGNANASENTVKISVSGDTKYAKALTENVKTAAEDVLDECDIEGKIEKIEAMNMEALRALAASTALYEEDEIAEMDENQLYAVLAESRVETALLLTEDMRNAYHAAKEYEISFAEREETAKIIKAMGGLYTLTYTAYKTALDVYSSAITALDTFRYEALVSPDSPYQRSLAALREAKVELLKQKTYTATLEVNGEEYTAATITLRMTEEQYETALKAYEDLGKAANDGMMKLIDALRDSEKRMRELEATIFDDNIEETLKAHVLDIEAGVNAAKDRFFASFENAHADDIARIEAELIAKKQELRDHVESAS